MRTGFGMDKLLSREIRARNMVVYPLIVVLDGFNPKKDAAQADGCDEEENQQHALPSLCAPNRHGHRKTGADEHSGIRGTQRYVGGAAGGHERVVVHVAVNQISSEEAAEEHDFSDEEDPHAEAGGIALLIHGVKVVTQRRMMVLMCGLDGDGAVTIRQLPPLLFRFRNRKLRG